MRLNNEDCQGLRVYGVQHVAFSLVNCPEKVGKLDPLFSKGRRMKLWKHESCSSSGHVGKCPMILNLGGMILGLIKALAAASPLVGQGPTQSLKISEMLDSSAHFRSGMENPRR